MAMVNSGWGSLRGFEIRWIIPEHVGCHPLFSPVFLIAIPTDHIDAPLDLDKKMILIFIAVAV